MESKRIILFFIASALSLFAQAQCDTTVSICQTFIPENYVSDGQTYRSFLVEDEIAEFHTTFFAGVDYRIAVMSGTSAGNIEFRLLDTERNLLFSSRDYNLTPFWNFQADATQDCIIEAQLDKKSGGSGCAVVLISFKR